MTQSEPIQSAHNLLQEVEFGLQQSALLPPSGRNVGCTCPSPARWGTWKKISPLLQTVSIAGRNQTSLPKVSKT